jgi:protein-S-isoprenylcysteine O-methyltransferase Ste14
MIAPMRAVLWTAAAWALWCTLHSGLIARPVTDWLRKRLGARFGCYRLAYNAFSAASLLPLAALHWRLMGPPLLRYRGAWIVLALILNASAALLFVLGARAYGMADFMGVRSARAAWRGEPLAEVPSFSTRGILRWVRHPWYLAGVLVVWGHDLDAAGLSAASVLTLYFLAGAWLEERKLVATYGEAYRAYQREVPMLIPRRPGGGMKKDEG